jgi:hypothetical protein
MPHAPGINRDSRRRGMQNVNPLSHGRWYVHSGVGKAVGHRMSVAYRGSGKPSGPVGMAWTCAGHGSRTAHSFEWASALIAARTRTGWLVVYG